MPDSITVTGSGAASAAPDVVLLSLGAEVAGDTPARVFEATNRAIDTMLAALRAGGVADTDLQTSGASVQEWHEQSGGRYHAGQRLTAVVRDIGGAGALVTAVIEAGGTAARLHGLSFAFSDAEALTRSAQEAAWQDAHAKAERYAALAGRRLGPVLRIAAVGAGMPIPRMRRALAAESAAMVPPMPVEGGQGEVSVGVEVEWALAD